jgi:transposase
MVTQNAHHRQRMLSYFYKHGATKTAIRYHQSRKTVYKWVKRYDGSLQSLEDLSHRPRSHPNQHTNRELKHIKRYIKQYGRSDLLLIFQKLRDEKGYKRHYGSFKRLVARMFKEVKRQRAKKKPKPYERAEYPGQKVQIDVKYVPSHCVAGGGKYYQFTAVDECTRWTYREMYNEKSTYEAYDFLKKLILNAPFPIRKIQTDNGVEFTNSLLVIKSKHKTMFEHALEQLDIIYQRIRIATPRHNGKVERQHRTDQLRFYRKLRMYSLEDGRKQLAVYQVHSNNHIKTCLNFRSPNQVLEDYLAVM